MKKIFKTMLFSIMIGTQAVLSSCGFSMEETYVISGIKTEELQNGDVLVTIVYEDEEVEPTTFVVPKGQAGEDGEDGIGIEKIEPTQSGDGLYTILTITYSNEETKVIRVPNGISVTGITTPTVDENGNTIFSFIYSDGSQSEAISLPKGEKGEDGIDGREVEFNVTDTHIQWRYKSDDPENPNEWENLVSLEELTGNGVDSVDIVEDPAYKTYDIVITYSDGNKQSLTINKPNRWYAEYYSPSSKDGFDGDMWYNKQHHIIFTKENGKWVEILSLTDDLEVDCQVTFDLNVSKDDPNQALLPSGTSLYYTIDYGKSFFDLEISMPCPVREGYEFAGWYATKTPTAVNGMFTDLTEIKKEELTLYAKWEKTTENNESSEENN